MQTFTKSSVGVLHYAARRRFLKTKQFSPENLMQSFLLTSVSSHNRTCLSLEVIRCRDRDDYQNVTRGKVLLVFVTTDCDACRKELVNVSQVVPSLASKVTVYGVGIEDRDSVNTFIEANHVAFPILLDRGAVILSRLGFKLMPTKILLQDGIITKIWYGSSPDRTALIKDVGEVEVK